MADTTNNKTPTDINNVYQAEYVQDEDNLNTEISPSIDIFYTDLGPISSHATPFLSEGEAANYAGRLSSYFPTNCIELYSVYYTYTIDQDKYTFTPVVCKIIPKGTAYSEGNSWAGLRKVTKKHLNEIYFTVDYIRIKRPVDSIKWFRVSKEEMAEYLNIMRQFYGLTNFPDKTGDFVFSKKVGKWLATNKLTTLIANGVVEIDFNNENPGSSTQVGSTLTFWQKIQKFFEKLGKILFGWLSLYNNETWVNFINTIFSGPQSVLQKILDTSLEDLDNMNSEFWKNFSIKDLFKGQSSNEDGTIFSDWNFIDVSREQLDKFFGWLKPIFNISGENIPFENLINNMENTINNFRNLTNDSSEGIKSFNTYINNYQNKIKEVFSNNQEGFLKPVWNFVKKLLKSVGINID